MEPEPDKMKMKLWEFPMSNALITFRRKSASNVIITAKVVFGHYENYVLLILISTLIAGVMSKTKFTLEFNGVTTSQVIFKVV